MLGLIILIFRVNIFKLPRSVVLLVVTISFLTKPNALLYISSCPDCFGNELCKSIANGDIQFHWFSKFLLIFQPSLTKSVFFGNVNGTRDVVLKSMTRRARIPVKRYELKERELFEDIIKDNILISDENIRNVILCPNFRSLHLLFEAVDDNITNLIQNKNLWFDIKISIEPLLLKFLSSVDMPVPGYYGACGDVIVKEFRGKALNNYFDHNWITRAFLSVQLLDMAELFTFHHEKLVFYFTDISSDNIAVDTAGMIYLTDLDHVIITERRLNYSGDLSKKGIVHVSAVLDPVKLTVSPSDVCKNVISDHNYFAVCRNILLYSEEVGRGLLSDIPNDFLKEHYKVQELLQECAIPKKFDNRIIAGRLLRNHLNAITSHIEWKKNS